MDPEVGILLFLLCLFLGKIHLNFLGDNNLILCLLYGIDPNPASSISKSSLSPKLAQEADLWAIQRNEPLR